jgi:DNA invertase Pin-like site-specific DNA recombinase
MNAIGYLRVSTGRQEESGAGIAAQRAAITAEAERRGWTVTFLEETASGKSAVRPKLELALAMLASGAAGALIVSKMDRLSRSLLDFVEILQVSQRRKWVLLPLDCPVDLQTPIGKAMATILMAFAQWEREVIGERTKDGLAEKRLEGVVLGRPRELSEEVRARIHREALRPVSLRGIAAMLNSEGVPTAHGGAAWHASTIKRILAA